MGNRIRNFLRLRKQSDTVKMICLFALAAVVFLVYTVYHVWGICQYVSASAEYILTGEGAVSDKRMKELLQEKDVSKVSRQMEIPVSVQYKGTETTVECTVLSPEYIQELSDIKFSEGSSRIYMNEKAFSEFKKTISENSGSTSYEEESGAEAESPELTVRYSMEEDAGAARGGSASGGGDDETGTGPEMETAVRSYRSAKLVILKTGREEAESFIYTAETDRRLLQEAVSIRVQFEKHDLDGLHVESLKNMGYEIENEETIITEEYELQIKLLHIRYGLVICGICSIAVFTLVRRRNLNLPPG